MRDPLLPLSAGRRASGGRSPASQLDIGLNLKELTQPVTGGRVPWLLTTPHLTMLPKEARCVRGLKKKVCRKLSLPSFGPLQSLHFLGSHVSKRTPRPKAFIPS